MMHRRFFLSAAALAVLIIATAGCRSTGSRKSENASTEPAASAPAEPASPLPPLVVDTDAPLLLDEHAEPDPAEPVGGADNSPCLVCHANYRHEDLAAAHAAVMIGCAGCHGESIPHRNDENNTIPPDKMFARDIIDTACVRCHKGHDVAPAKVIARYKERALDKTDDTVVCTDCHGDHRLKLRTVNWDKKTGKLLQTNKQ
ncbi:MAG TPA: cytochrome c3 family protein [Anaerohalosphaeraceae bacterium]|jgi:hypothetical protein|nr:cytochrome c3 family protein [Anaerohalosphaeraceae bacterium]HRT51074.1 cytochrome c3 family protein [Anaerohalosphaeraceae bacterium]HRT87089.1 cytochrome c3 family protein [Anaerohalosphaeraceae bacterium]